MKVAIIGGGPSGLYLGMLLSEARIAKVDIFEQNPPDATFGFGVTLADSAMSRFQKAHPQSLRELSEAMVWVSDQLIKHPDGNIDIRSKISAGSIERIQMLQILLRYAEAAGVIVKHGADISCLSELEDYDLVVGADGANSFLRRTLSEEFGVTKSKLSNRFAWYGVDHTFASPTLSFFPFGQGSFCGHYYPYTSQRSTFVAECDEAGWQESGLADLSDRHSRRERAQEIFADDLEGHKLIDNRSIWRQFEVVHLERWVYQKYALIGDALYPAHFSIGSGTRLAMDDALALKGALEECDDLSKALSRFSESRRPTKQKLQSAAEKSFGWYEDMASKLELSPLAFAYDYMTRTGRVDDERLELIAPDFMAAVRKSRVICENEGSNNVGA